MQQPVWLNFSILINGKPCVNKRAYQAGILHLGDLMEDRKLCSFSQITAKCNNHN